MPRYDRGGKCTPVHYSLSEVLLGGQLRHKVVKPFLLCKMGELVEVKEFFVEHNAIAQGSDLLVQSRGPWYNGKERAQDPNHLL